MPKTAAVPAYRLHKPSGQARVIIRGRHIYLGPYGSPASQEKYGRLIAEWKGSRGLPPPTTSRPSDGLLVVELVNAYRRWSEAYYVKDGKPTGQVQMVYRALRAINSLYGTTSAVEFGPLALRAVQQHLVERGNCRSYINHLIGTIRRMYRWAASQEMLPVTSYQALATVPGLKRGRTQARETKPVAPVDDAGVDATLPHLPLSRCRAHRVGRRRTGEHLPRGPAHGHLFDERPGFVVHLAADYVADPETC